MKIAVDCRVKGGSGIKTFLEGILPHLKASGNEILLIGSTEGVRCALKPFSLQELFCFPKDILRKINTCDVYFTPYCNVPGGIKVPVFSTIHDVIFLDMKLSGAIGTLARRFFYKRALRISRTVFTVSNFSKERIQAHLGHGTKVCVVYNGVPRYVEEAQERIGEVQKDGSIVFVGSIKKHKGLSVLLQAFEKLLQGTGVKHKLLIVGAGENFRTKDGSVLAKIDEINANFPGAVEFTGFVENERLVMLLAKAHVLVQPSLYEGFGIPPLEAMSLGTKALLSDIPALKEIYEGFPVVFFRSGDADDLCEKLKAVLADDTPLATLPQKYSYLKTANAILDEFATALRGVTD